MAQIRWRRNTYTIQGRDGKEERTGIISSYFGFGITGNRCGYVITHLPSGLKCGETRTQRGSKDLCEALLGLPVEWYLTDPMRGVGARVRDQVMEAVSAAREK